MLGPRRRGSTRGLVTGEVGGQLVGHGGDGEPDSVSHALDLPQRLLGRKQRDGGDGGPGGGEPSLRPGKPVGVPLDLLVDDEVGQRPRPEQRVAESVPAVPLQQRRRVRPWLELDDGDLDVRRVQEWERSCGGSPSGVVAVEGDGEVSAGSAGVEDGLGLGGGEGGAAGGEAAVLAVGGEVDGDGVEGSFDEDGGGAGLPEQPGLGEPEDGVALAVERGLGGVEVLGCAAVGVGGGAADEGDDVSVDVADGEHEPVAEAVDEPAGAGAGGQPGGLDGVVAVPGGAQVVGQAGPLGGGVADAPGGGGVEDGGQAALAQVAGDPAGHDLGLEVGGGVGVDGEQLLALGGGRLAGGQGLGAVEDGLGVGGEVGGLLGRGSGVLGVGEDASGGLQDALPGGGDDVLGLLAAGVGGPGGDVGEGVGVGGQAVAGGDQVGDAFGLDLGDAAADERLVAVGGVVQQDVSELVGEGLDGLGVVDVVADADGAGGEVGGAVGAVAVAAVEGEAGVGDEAGEGVPEPVGGVAFEQDGVGWLGQGLAGGLGDVPDVGDAVADEPGLGRGVVVLAGGGVGGGAAAQDRGEDGDAALALVDLAAEVLPGAVAGDAGGVGAGGQDGDGVLERVGVEAAGDAQPALPVLAGAQLADLVGEALVEGGEAVLAGGGVGHGQRLRWWASRSRSACWRWTVASRCSTWACMAARAARTSTSTDVGWSAAVLAVGVGMGGAPSSAGGDGSGGVALGGGGGDDVGAVAGAGGRGDGLGGRVRVGVVGDDARLAGRSLRRCLVPAEGGAERGTLREQRPCLRHGLAVAGAAGPRQVVGGHGLGVQDGEAGLDPLARLGRLTVGVRPGHRGGPGLAELNGAGAAEPVVVERGRPGEASGRVLGEALLAGGAGGAFVFSRELLSAHEAQSGNGLEDGDAHRGHLGGSGGGLAAGLVELGCGHRTGLPAVVRTG